MTSCNKYALKYVPGQFKTKNLCKISVLWSGENIKYIPHNIIDEEICKMAVTNVKPKDQEHTILKGDNLKHIPENWKTSKLCNFAITQDPKSLKYVPEILITYDMCLNAVKICQLDSILKYIPYKYKTYEICKIACGNSGKFGSINAIKYVPYNLITYELCEISIKYTNGLALEYIPEQFKNKSIIKLAQTLH